VILLVNVATHPWFLTQSLCSDKQSSDETRLATAQHRYAKAKEA